MSPIALLAPVPLEHLQDGAGVCTSEGKVAFGSRAWEVFRELDAERNGRPVDVFIYASGDPAAIRLEAAWHAIYIGHVEGKNGAHPAGMQFRPPSTGKYPTDNKGHWAIFWEVEHLRELQPDERISIELFMGYRSSKSYKKNFVPEGPLLVIHPHA